MLVLGRLLPLGLTFVFAVQPQVEQLRLGAKLDADGKCDEAERQYQQALAMPPATPPLLNDVGNHYLHCGDATKAETYFERLLKLNPAHTNAHLQLARIAAD